jgi:putative transposase
LSQRCQLGLRSGDADRITSFSYRGHRFPASIIRHAICLYLRFILSYRNVEELLRTRLDASYEAIRRWVLKFGPLLACLLRQCQPRPGDHRHLDKIAVLGAWNNHPSLPGIRSSVI